MTLVSGIRWPVLLVGAVWLAATPPLHAQADAPVSLGIGLSVVSPTSRDADATVRPALLLRLQGTGTVGPSIAFNWFSTKARTEIGGREAVLGKMIVRPIMAGISLSRRAGRATVSTSFESGYAFVHIRDTGAATRAHESLGATRVSVRAAGTWAWRTTLSAWYDLSDRYGVVAAVGYLGTRPTVTTSSSLGTSRQRIGLGSVVLTVGVAYSLF